MQHFDYKDTNILLLYRLWIFDGVHVDEILKQNLEKRQVLYFTFDEHVVYLSHNAVMVMNKYN